MSRAWGAVIQVGLMGAKQSCGKDDAADVTIESVENSFEADEILPSTLQPCKGIHDDINSEGTFNVDVMSDWATKRSGSGCQKNHI